VRSPAHDEQRELQARRARIDNSDRIGHGILNGHVGGERAPPRLRHEPKNGADNWRAGIVSSARQLEQEIGLTPEPTIHVYFNRRSPTA
jgi:hypothetical protein